MAGVEASHVTAEAAGSAPPAPPSATSGSLVGRRVRVGGHAATVRWGPGRVQAPPSKRPAAVAGAASEAGGADGDAGGEALPAAPATVEVLGIEYDEAGHGKHDGTHQGARLFQCEAGLGSFVKVEKAELGISFQRALAEKYFAAMLPTAAQRGARAEAVDAMEYVDSKGRDKEMTVELVGRYGIEQRQQRLEGFVEIALAESNLSGRYPEDVWDGDWSLPNLKSLWLDKTLIEDWSDVMAICELCPQLEWLSLVRTRPGIPRVGGDDERTAAAVPVGAAAAGIAGSSYSSRAAALRPPRGAPALGAGDQRLALTPFTCQVRTLVLSSSAVTWRDLLALDAAAAFPCLEHLHLAQNRLSEGIPAELATAAEAVEAAAAAAQAGREQPAAASEDGDAPAPRPWRQPFPNLKTLILDGNGISDWRVIRRAIVLFPALQALHLNGNLLGQTLDGLAELAADERPRRLTALFLNENRVSSWKALGALSRYALLELKLQRNPVTDGATPVASPQLLRQVLIALMPTLMRLNASEIPAKERVAAERYLLAAVGQAAAAVGATTGAGGGGGGGGGMVEALGEACDLPGHAARLRAVHGEVVGGDVTEEAQAARSALVHALVQVSLRPIGAAILDQAPVKKRLPHTMTVAELKRLCQQIFKQVPLPRVRLLLADPGLPFGVPFDDESRELGFYGVCDGAEIRVDDTADASGDREASRVEGLAARMEQVSVA